MLNFVETASSSTTLPVAPILCRQSQDSTTSYIISPMNSVQPSFQFRNVTVTLNNEEFRRAFFNGRRYYYTDISCEFPERATTLTATEAFSQITIHDTQTGHYHLDAEGIAHPVEFLGVFLGYIMAPLFPETKEEQQQRRAEEATYILIDEPVSPA